jgi:hypothetical protein
VVLHAVARGRRIRGAPSIGSHRHGSQQPLALLQQGQRWCKGRPVLLYRHGSGATMATGAVLPWPQQWCYYSVGRLASIGHRPCYMGLPVLLSKGGMPCFKWEGGWPTLLPVVGGVCYMGPRALLPMVGGVATRGRRPCSNRLSSFCYLARRLLLRAVRQRLLRRWHIFLRRHLLRWWRVFAASGGRSATSCRWHCYKESPKLLPMRQGLLGRRHFLWWMPLLRRRRFFAASGGALCYKLQVALLQMVVKVATNATTSSLAKASSPAMAFSPVTGTFSDDVWGREGERNRCVRPPWFMFREREGEASYARGLSVDHIQGHMSAPQPGG